MTLLHKFFTTTAIAVLLGASGGSLAQDRQEQDRDRAAKAKSSTVVGCLTKSDEDHWIVTDSSGKKVTVQGSSDFEKHNNHTVKLYGAPNDDGTSFTVDRIEHVSDTCEQ